MATPCLLIYLVSSGQPTHFKERHFKGLINDFKFSPECRRRPIQYFNERTCAHQKTIFRPAKRPARHRIVIDIMKDRSATLMAKQKSEGTLQMRRTTSQRPTLETERMVAGPGAIPIRPTPPKGTHCGWP